MPKISLDGETLVEIRGSLSSIEGRFSDSASEHAEDNADGLGPERLVDKARDYIEDSTAAYERMAKNIRDIKDAIDPVLESFEEADLGLASELVGEEGSGPPARRRSPALAFLRTRSSDTPWPTSSRATRPPTR